MRRGYPTSSRGTSPRRHRSAGWRPTCTPLRWVLAAFSIPLRPGGPCKLRSSRRWALRPTEAAVLAEMGPGAELSGAPTFRRGAFQGPRGDVPFWGVERLCRALDNRDLLGRANSRSDRRGSDGGRRAGDRLGHGGHGRGGAGSRSRLGELRGQSDLSGRRPPRSPAASGPLVLMGRPAAPVGGVFVSGPGVGHGRCAVFNFALAVYVVAGPVTARGLLPRR
jgi:hypothetical protein